MRTDMLMYHMVFALAGNFLCLCMFLVFCRMNQPVGMAMVLMAFVLGCASAFGFIQGGTDVPLALAWMCTTLGIVTFVYALVVVFHKN